MQLFVSHREFVLFSYDVSHGLLLFRSGIKPPHKTRIDILFQDVRAIETRSTLEGLTIEEATPDFLSGLRSRPDEVIEHGHKIYALKSGNWVGFVVGGIVSQHEDMAGFFEPSKLIQQ